MKRTTIVLAVLILAIPQLGGAGEIIFNDDFAGTVIDASKWEVYDTRLGCAPGAAVTQDDSLIIWYPPDANNCPKLGLMSVEDFSGETGNISFEVDFWTTELRNWQDNPLELIFPLGRIVYNNYSGWHIEWDNAAGAPQDFDPSLGVIWEHRYGFKAEVASDTLRFWADTDQAGYALLLEIPAGQYSVPFNLEQHGYAAGSNGRIMLLQSDRGHSYYDNLVVTREVSAPPVCEDGDDCSEPYMTDDCTVGLWHLNEESGSIAYDASGHSQDGQVFGATWNPNGRFGGALEFLGQGDVGSDSVRIVLDDVSFIAGPHTLEAWIFPYSIGEYQTIMSLYGMHDQIPIYVLPDGRLSFRIVRDSPYLRHELLSKTALQPQQWYHVAGVWNGSEISIYINGVRDTATVLSFTPTPPVSNVLDIGKIWTTASTPNGARSFFNGLIDEVRISNTAREFTLCEPAHTIAVDIKPGSCPNPLNVKRKGGNSVSSAKRGPGAGMGAVLPVAILGKVDFDVNDIDPASVQLAGVAPWRWNTEDVATPVADGASACECTTEGPDGYTDLTLKFPRGKIVDALGTVSNGEEISLSLTGRLTDGTMIEGSDCVVIRGQAPVPDFISVVKLANYPNPFNASTQISYTLSESGRVSLSVFNILGQEVTNLVNEYQEAGAHSVAWDGTDRSGRVAASGVYFYRIQAGQHTEAKKMHLLK